MAHFELQPGLTSIAVTHRTVEDKVSIRIMDKCRLVIVEGIPGSGKSTTASYVKAFLDRQGIPNRLYNEGDPDQPADFEGVAYFTRSDYESFLSDHAPYRHLLEQNTIVDGGDYFVPYRRLKLDDGQTPPDELIASLAQHDVYETPLAGTYCRLAATRWQHFANKAVAAEEVFIFECCFLQNPLTVLLGKHNIAVPQVLDHVQMIERAIQPLQPSLIYLRQEDPRTTLERISGERPQEWKDFLVAYFTQQGWGKATEVHGFEGVMAFYAMLQRVELDFIEQSGIDNLLIDTDAGDWAEVHSAIDVFLRSTFGLAPS